MKLALQRSKINALFFVLVGEILFLAACGGPFPGQSSPTPTPMPTQGSLSYQLQNHTCILKRPQITTSTNGTQIFWSQVSCEFAGHTGLATGQKNSFLSVSKQVFKDGRIDIEIAGGTVDKAVYPRTAKFGYVWLVQFSALPGQVALVFQAADLAKDPEIILCPIGTGESYTVTFAGNTIVLHEDGHLTLS